MRVRRSFLLVAATSLAVLVSASLALAGARSAPSGGSPTSDSDVYGDPVVSEPVVVGPADPAAIIDIGLALRGQDPEGLERTLAELTDPASPNYRHYLTAEEFGDRFGLSAEDEEELVTTLTANGLEVVGRFPQRTSVRARGTVADVSRLLGTPLEQVEDAATGRTWVAAPGELVVPAALSAAVTGVTGLERYRPVSAIDPADAPPPPTRGLKPQDLAIAYGYQSLWDAGIRGAGTHVAILQYGVDTDEDLAVYDAAFGLQGPAPERISVGNGLVDAPADFAAEAALDTQVVRAAAPEAQILVFGFDKFTSFGDAVNAIVADGRAKIISLSYGLCMMPDYLPQAVVDADNAALQAAAATGVSLFVASGDWGAFTCHRWDLADHRESTFWPSCSDFAIGVGGTFLETREDGTYLRETGWQDYLVTGGTGGGVSPLHARPAWQVGEGVDTSDGAPRQCPDVAAAADSDTGYLIFFTDTETGEAGWRMIGGTSAAAPLWAGMTALMTQAAAQQGIAELGFVAPLLYQVREADPSVFHDVVRGGNLVSVSGPGFDQATGLGSPDLAALTDAVIETLR
jgi:kumamolisin